MVYCRTRFSRVRWAMYRKDRMRGREKNINIKKQENLSGYTIDILVWRMRIQIKNLFFLIPLWASLGFLAGIAIASAYTSNVGIAVAIAGSLSIAVAIFTSKKAWIFTILFLAAILGLWYCSMRMRPSVSSSDI